MRSLATPTEGDAAAGNWEVAEEALNTSDAATCCVDPAGYQFSTPPIKHHHIFQSRKTDKVYASPRQTLQRERSCRDGSCGQSQERAQFEGFGTLAVTFALGALTMLVVQKTLFPSACSGCPTTTDMTTALYSELEIAQQSILECRRSRRLASSGITLDSEHGISPISELVLPTNPPFEKVVIRIDDHAIPEDNVQRPAANIDPLPLDSKSEKNSGAPIQPRSLERLWGLCLFLVDAGLVYFCLLQGTSKETKSLLESFIMRSKNPDPSLESQRTTAFVRNAFPRSRLSEDIGRKRQTHIAVALASLTVGAMVRLLLVVVSFVGIQFFHHLFAYAVLTIRICLLVLLVLF